MHEENYEGEVRFGDNRCNGSRIHNADSGKGWFNRNGDRDGHRDRTRKSLKNRNKMFEFSDDHRSSKYGINATESDGGLSHRNWHNEVIR